MPGVFLNLYRTGLHLLQVGLALSKSPIRPLTRSPDQQTEGRKWEEQEEESLWWRQRQRFNIYLCSQAAFCPFFPRCSARRSSMAAGPSHGLQWGSPGLSSHNSPTAPRDDAWHPHTEHSMAQCCKQHFRWNPIAPYIGVLLQFHRRLKLFASFTTTALEWLKHFFFSCVELIGLKRSSLRLFPAEKLSL